MAPPRSPFVPGDQGPTVVGSGLDKIDFVAARLSVFGNEEIAGGVPRKALRIPVAVGIDIGSLEGIVRRHLSVACHAEDLAGQAAEVLRQCTVFGPARRDIHKSVGTDRDASSIVEPVTRNAREQHARLSL